MRTQLQSRPYQTLLNPTTPPATRSSVAGLAHDKTLTCFSWWPYSDCKAAIALDPLYVKGHLRAGMALGLLERPQEGLDHYIAAIEIEPHNEQVTHSPSHLKRVGVATGSRPALQR